MDLFITISHLIILAHKKQGANKEKEKQYRIVSSVEKKKLFSLCVILPIEK